MNQVAIYIKNPVKGGGHRYLIIGPRIPGSPPINQVFSDSSRERLDQILRDEWPDAVVIAEAEGTKELWRWTQQFIRAPLMPVQYQRRDALDEARREPDNLQEVIESIPQEKRGDWPTVQEAVRDYIDVPADVPEGQKQEYVEVVMDHLGLSTKE